MSRKRTKHARWEDLAKVLVASGHTTNPLPSCGRVSRMAERGAWIIGCRCGKPWRPTLGSWKKGVALSCGNCSTPTVGDLCDVVVSRGGVVLQTPGSYSDLAFIGDWCVKNWRLKCRCGKEYSTSTQSIREGAQTCGCRIGVHPASKYKFGDVRKICKEFSLVFLHDDISDEQALYHVMENDEWSFRCFCNRDFRTRLNDIVGRKVRSCGCVKSHEENDVAEFISSLGVDIIRNSRKIIAPLELDIYIPDKKLAIEFNGVHWHGEKVRGKEARSDCIKKLDRCEELGIRLITIFEDEWVMRREAVENYLRSIFQKKKRVFGRKCEVVKNHPDAISFVEKNHIQGNVRGKHYSLLYEGRIVAVAVFGIQGASRVAKGERHWELTRYCVGEYAVLGGQQKLVAAFAKDFPSVRKIVSYSDRRWSVGHIYETTGFKKTRVSRPSYWYFRSGNCKRFHRFNFTKKRAVLLYGNAGTEWDIMSANGWDRIWDAGAVRWELDINEGICPVSD